MEWMILPFKRYFDFQGRSRRMEYWMFQLLNIAVSMVLFSVILAGFPWDQMIQNWGTVEPDIAAQPPQFSTSNWVIIGSGSALYLIWWLATFIPSIAVTVRRLHDREVSGWWYGGLFVAGFIPLVNVLAVIGWIVFLVFMFLPGTDGPNRYGLDPKNLGQTNVFE